MILKFKHSCFNLRLIKFFLKFKAKYKFESVYFCRTKKFVEYNMKKIRIIPFTNLLDAEFIWRKTNSTNPHLKL